MDKAEDKDKFTIFQFPNKYLWIMIFSWLISHFSTGTLAAAARAVFVTSAIIWSYEEITSGVNIFRKILGALVLASLVFGLFKLYLLS